MNVSFLHFSPILFFVVRGKSMLPALQEGEVLMVFRFLRIHPGDVVALKHPITKSNIIKRIQKEKEDTFWVVGDNIDESTDSRDFGWILKKDIIGKVIFHKS